MITFENVTKSYGNGAPALSNLNIEIEDGEFVFERETIEGIMERLSRWYDVKIFYGKESLKQKRFTGVVSRYEDITQVLRLIEGPATLRFEVKGNVVTVKDRE